VRPLEIVVGNPIRDLGASIVKFEEQGLVEQFVAHPAIDGEDGPAFLGAGDILAMYGPANRSYSV